MDSRLYPTPWRHDGYTLSRLRVAIESLVTEYVRTGLLDPRRSIVVDLGAGDAPYRPLFAGRCHSYIACDLATSETTDLIFDGHTPIDMATGMADCVVSFQVLEHVWDLHDYLGECRRLLSAGGRLLLSTHGTWLFHPHPDDFRRWTRDGLARELADNGFEVVSILPAVGPLAWTTQFRSLAYAHVLRKAGPPGRLLAAALCWVMNLRMRMEDAATPADMRERNAAIYVVDAKVAALP